MNAKMNAIAMTLLMIASALAGCTSGDPDGDDTSGIDMEILNQMIDDNLQDFINNTTIVVNNHYHNNTTYIVDDGTYHDIVNNNFNNTTYQGDSIDQSEVIYDLGQGNYSTGENGEITFIIHREMNLSEFAPELVNYQPYDPAQATFTYNKTYNGYVWIPTNSSNSSSEGYYDYQQLTMLHTDLSCSVFYTFQNSDSPEYGIYFENFWDEEQGYYNYFADIYGEYDDTNYTMTGWDYYNAGSADGGEYFASECLPVDNYYGEILRNYYTLVEEIQVPIGYSIVAHTLQVFAEHGNRNYSSSYLQMEYFPGYNNYWHTSVNQYGGWDNLTIQARIYLPYVFSETEITYTIRYTFAPVIVVE